MQDCKNALKENNNNIEKSIEYLRKKGVLKAAKEKFTRCCRRFDRAGEDQEALVLIEINTETDFVAKNSEFLNFCSKLSASSTKLTT